MLAVACIALHGCSWFLARSAPAGWTPERDPGCRADYVEPIADGALAAIAAVTAVAVLTEDCGLIDFACEDQPEVGVFSAVLAAAFVASSATGVVVHRRCARQQREHEAWRARAP